jgi:hypothetical protein
MLWGEGTKRKCCTMGCGSTSAAPPLPRGERGVASCNALRGEPKGIFHALLRRKKNCGFGRQGLAAREGSAFSNRSGSRVSGVPPVGGKESVPLREKFYSADSCTIKIRKNQTYWHRWGFSLVRREKLAPSKRAFTGLSAMMQKRGREGSLEPPPAQICTGPIRAYGSYLELGCISPLTSKRLLGRGCTARGGGR